MSQYNRDLYDSVLRGNAKLVKAYLDRGARVYQLDYHGIPLMIHAVDSGNVEIVKLLLARDPVMASVPSRDGKMTPLLAAVKKGHADIVRALLDVGSIQTEENPAIHYARPSVVLQAVYDNDGTILKMLYEAGADLKKPRNAAGQSALFLADSPEMVNYLASAGLNVNEKDTSGHTPLFYAVQSKRKELVEALMDAGAKPDETFTQEMNAYVAGLRRSPLMALRQELLKGGRKKRRNVSRT